MNYLPRSLIARRDKSWMRLTSPSPKRSHLSQVLTVIEHDSIYGSRASPIAEQW